MQIRFAKPEDIPGILALLQQVGRLHYEGRPDIFREDAQKYDAEQLQELLADPDRPILVAAKESQILGYAFCVRKEIAGHSVLKDDCCLYIDDLCVDAACRGQGVGSQLYHAAQTLAKEMGLRRITLNVWAFNQQALAFYEKCGMTMERIFMEAPVEDTPC